MNWMGSTIIYDIEETLLEVLKAWAHSRIKTESKLTIFKVRACSPKYSL